jgi:hypothetical protein
MMVGLLNFTLLKAYIQSASTLQSKTLMDILERPPEPGSRLPAPVHDLLRACGEVEAFEQTVTLLNVLDLLGSPPALQKQKMAQFPG